MARQPIRRFERMLPLVYFAAVALLAVALLPTVLRPPTQQPNQSAELSPDAPPNANQQAIMTALGRAQSGTAGTGDSSPLDAGAPSGVTTTTTPSLASVVQAPRACPHGVGSPPRQTDWIYAPP